MSKIVKTGDTGHGKARVEGTRIPVRTLYGLYKDGLDPEEIAGGYPTITHEAVTARLVDRRYTGTVVVTGSGISS